VHGHSATDMASFTDENTTGSVMSVSTSARMLAVVSTSEAIVVFAFAFAFSGLRVVGFVVGAAPSPSVVMPSVAG